MPASPQLPSKNQINKAGDYLSDLLAMSAADFVTNYDPEKYAAAVRVVSDYRAAHQRPLGATSQGLRQIVRSETGAQPIVSQRLKRVPRILRKLNRMGHGGLARLEDIGGCRAVLPDADVLERVREHVGRTWKDIIIAERRSVHSSTSMGYRAYHLTILKFDRKIEVQLRTVGQQRWADSVERTDSRHGLTLKDGVGPESLVDYFSGAGEMIYSLEYGVPRSDSSITKFREAREKVISEGYFRRKGE